MNTLTGRQELVNIIMAQSELDKPFQVTQTYLTIPEKKNNNKTSLVVLKFLKMFINNI